MPASLTPLSTTSTFKSPRRGRNLPIDARLQTYTAILFVAWWITNASYAIHTDRLFRAHPFNAYAVDLTLAQTLLAVTLMSIFFVFVEQSNSSLLGPATHWKSLLRHAWASPALLLAGASHLSAAILTALSFATAGATTTLIWKFAEPLSTIIVKRIILSSTYSPSSSSSSLSRHSASSTPPTAIFSVLAILAGCVAFSWTADTSIPALIPVLLANIITPLRNTCIKRYQLHTSFDLPSDNSSRSNHSHSPLLSFVSLTISTIPFIPLLILLRIVYHNLFFVPASLTTFDVQLFAPSWSSILQNAVLFTLYQGASICLLSLVDPVTHAVLNALKRLAALVIASVVLHFHQLSIRHVIASIISTVGFATYAVTMQRMSMSNGGFASRSRTGMTSSTDRAARTDPAKLHKKPQSNLFAGLLVATAIAIVVVLSFSARRTSLDRLIASRLEDDPSSAEEREIMSMAIHVRVMPYAHQNFSLNSYADHANVPGNLGDMLWKYGANERTIKLPVNRTVNCAMDVVTPWSCLHEVISDRESPVVIHAPMANYISDHFGHLLHVLATYSRHERVKHVVINGIGIQEDFSRNGLNSADCRNANSVREAARRYELASATRADVGALADSSRVTVLTRGEVSRLVLRKTGVMNGHSIGCPSLWENFDEHLGESLAKKYESVSRRVNDSSLKVAIPVRAFPRYNWVHQSLAARYPSAVFVAQTSHDFVKLSKMGIPFERVRVYTSAEAWIAGMRDFDFVFGGRMHGVLAAVAAGTPALAIAVDWRMAELCLAMNIPFVTPFDDYFVKKRDLDIANIVGDVVIPFDSREFDYKRCQAARVLQESYADVGLYVHDHIQQIARQC